MKEKASEREEEARVRLCAFFYFTPHDYFANIIVGECDTSERVRENSIARVL